MWKKAMMGITAAAAALTLSACGGASAGNSSAPAAAPEGKSIVVYYSATGNTKRAAETIAKETGSDIYAITPKVPYTEADLDYNNSTSRVSKEHRDSSIRPEYTGMCQTGTITRWCTWATPSGGVKRPPLCIPSRNITILTARR